MMNMFTTLAYRSPELVLQFATKGLRKKKPLFYLYAFSCGQTKCNIFYVALITLKFYYLFSQTHILPVMLLGCSLRHVALYINIFLAKDPAVKLVGMLMPNVLHVSSHVPLASSKVAA